MALAPGSRLGDYEIVSALGAGGMGEVYRARDSRLDRDVAIKVLAESLANDPTALARFEREALSVAKLSHPNILAIYELGKHAGTTFVAMELVEGDTLRARLEHGPISARKSIAYALQIARGLGAAHGRGIVHRDLKPENVMVGRDDHVKILDFGLAKPIDTAGTEMTRGVSLATNAGTVLGTFGYMAPEQVRGLAVDHRADMFAFGALLYEMLSGKRAFRGETAADTMSSILTKEPPDLDLGAQAIPSGLDRIIKRCLEKNAELRFQSASDLAFALDTLGSGTTSGATSGSSAAHSIGSATAGGAATVPTKSPISWLPWTIAAAALIAAAIAWMPRGSGVAPTVAASESFIRVTELGGEETSPALSPDGTTIAYVARAGSSNDIFTQRVGGRNSTPILADPNRDEGGPAFSPDGQFIAFHESDTDGGIFVAGATGESVRRLTDRGFHAAWSPDSKQITFTTEEIVSPSSRLGGAILFVVDAAGGTPRKVVEGDGVQASWSPRGDRLVYWANTQGQRDIYTVAIAGGERTAVTQDVAIDWSPVWSPDGAFIYFASDRAGVMNMWRIAVDPATGRPRGNAEPVTNGVQAETGLPSFSKDGSRLAFRSRIASVNPTSATLDANGRAGEPRVLDTSTNIRQPSDVSPDGTLLAYFNIGERQEDIFVGPPGGPIRRVTDDVARDRAPTFTPDGRWLIFYSNRDGQWDPWIVGIDGGGLRKLAAAPESTVYPRLSPDGATLWLTPGTGENSYTAPFTTSGVAKTTLVRNTKIGDLSFFGTGWSPDGKRLVGTLTARSGQPAGIAVYDIAKAEVTKVADDGAYGCYWLPDSRRVVYFVKGSNLVVLDTITRARTVTVMSRSSLAADEQFAVSRDGRTIYYGTLRSEADIWVMERK